MSLEKLGRYVGNAYENYNQYLYTERLRSMTPLQMVREFTEAFGQPLDQPHPFDIEGGVDDSSPEGELEGLRYSLISEEFDEFTESPNKENLLKELADIVYVVYGYAATYGLDLDEAFLRVHASNMSKLDDNGFPLKRDDGKILKGPNYKEPDLGDLI